MENMGVKQIGDFVLNHYGQVWDISFNECIFSGTYAEALDFFNSITE